MSIIFDGKEFARKKEEELKLKVGDLKKNGASPKLVSVLLGDNPDNALYVNLKKKAAERVGIDLEIVTSVDEIEKLNNDESVHGIMIQMPLPPEIKGSREEIINKIASDKDVDGLREDSKFLHPTALAITQIIEVAKKETGKNDELTYVVVGSTGMVGRSLVKELKRQNQKVVECDVTTTDLKLETLQGDILVSATGVANLIKAEMVKEGAIVVDVGYPQGDVDFSEVSNGVSFITPVPGGVGPVTIECLLENLINACG